MDDIFGSLAGGPPPSGPQLSALEDAFDGARLWGLELDLRYRVLAATLEPVEGRAPWSRDLEVADRRVQLLCFPVSTILASLRRTEDGAQELLTFTDAQLVDVVATLGGPPVTSPLFGRPEPRPGLWAPRFSLEGRSSAPDGIRATVTFEVTADDLTLQLFARFDDVEVRDADGSTLPPGG